MWLIGQPITRFVPFGLGFSRIFDSGRMRGGMLLWKCEMWFLFLLGARLASLGFLAVAWVCVWESEKKGMILVRFAT